MVGYSILLNFFFLSGVSKNMKYLKAFKYRLYPNKHQEEYFSKTFGCVRFIYNKMLNDKIGYYNEFKQVLKNTPAQYKDEFPFLKEVDSLALANAQMNLQSAYNNFFKNPKSGFPKFKSKKRDKDSYTTNNQGGNIYISEDNKYICLPKIKLVRIKLHRQLPQNSIIKSVTISKTKSGKYYISILCEYELDVQEKQLDIEKSLGLDYSSHDFYIDNNGSKANYPRYYRQWQNKLAKQQRKLSKMKLHSNNYEKQRIKIAKISEKIANQRLDFQHKLSTQLANTYDYIFVEDINLQGLSQCLRLGKSTMDNSFGQFRQLLQYKMLERGKIFHKIGRFEPTSQTCNECGCKHSITKDLSIRKWVCPDCGAELDRDINAAKNIRKSDMLAFS